MLGRPWRLACAPLLARALFFGAPGAARAQAGGPRSAVSAEALRARIEGVYDLEELHRDGQALRPPRVAGRFVLRHGVSAWIVHDLAQPGGPTARAGYGHYVVERGRFRSGFEEFVILDQAGSHIGPAPDTSLVTFAASVVGDTLRLRTADGAQELVFTAERQIFSERGQVVRAWRRIRKP